MGPAGWVAVRLVEVEVEVKVATGQLVVVTVAKQVAGQVVVAVKVGRTVEAFRHHPLPFVVKAEVVAAWVVGVKRVVPAG